MTELVGELGARITHVLETHLHNDYVTGGLELSRDRREPYMSSRQAKTSATPPAASATAR